MNSVALLAANQRAELFGETGERRGLPAVLVEKDFWVCWTLNQLFTCPELKGHIVFKGGTSLSKVFNAIQRFSEDIDLIIDYVHPFVLLEPGTNAEFVPKAEYEIRPFAAEEFPGVFEQTSVRLEAIKAERTFWEKATILHAEYHRTFDKPILGRHSRHYYDLAMLARTEVRRRALADAELRERVVKHKSDFYYSKWARYELAVPGTLRLVPPDERLMDLRKDYEGMRVFLFGESPTFDEILKTLRELEREINANA